MKTVFLHKYKDLGRAYFGGRRTLPLAILALFSLLPHAAMAQTLGDVMCNVSSNIEPFVWLFNGIAYIAGAYFIGHGLVLLSKHHENPRETHFHNPLMHLIGGAALLAFPSFINLLLHSFGLIGDGGGGMPVCSTGLVFTDASYTGLDLMLINLVNNVRDPMTVLVSIAAIVIGVIMIFRGLVKASKYGYDPRGTKMSHVLASLIVGSVLVVVGQSLSTMLTSIFGSSGISSSSDVLNWNFFNMLAQDDTGVANFQNAVIAALTFVQLIGMIAFVRGWIIIKNAVEGSGQATMAQGFTHIVGGVCAINIFGFLELMDYTFGTDFLI